MPGAFASILQQTRQHHAIEHATIHLLTASYPRRVFAGMSDPWGFTLYGQLPVKAIEEAVGEAVRRLQNGEEQLAFHPNCGTNLTTSILLVTAAAFLGSFNWQSSRRRTSGGDESQDPVVQPAGRRQPEGGSLPLDRMTWTAGLMTLALLISRPLGMRLQRLTTRIPTGDLGSVKVAPVRRGQAYRITFAALQ